MKDPVPHSSTIALERGLNLIVEFVFPFACLFRLLEVTVEAAPVANFMVCIASGSSVGLLLLLECASLWHGPYQRETEGGNQDSPSRTRVPVHGILGLGRKRGTRPLWMGNICSG